MRQIIAGGGGGYAMEPDNLALDRYILDQAHKEVPKVCFISTAGGDAAAWTLRFYESFCELNCKPTYLALYHPPKMDLTSFILDQDVLYVGGGSVRNLLALWREWNLDKIIRKAYETGVVLAGFSAGAMCWFEQCLDDRNGQGHVMDALGFLPGSFDPHYGSSSDFGPAYRRFIAEGKISAGYAAQDSAALHFVDEKIHSAVCSQQTAKVFKITGANGEWSEAPLEMTPLPPVAGSVLRW